MQHTRMLIPRGWIRTATLLLVVALLAACAGVQNDAPAAAPESAREPVTVKLGVGFIPNVQFAPFYVGIEKGFYADEGIALELEYGFENDYLKLVGVDELQFMVGSGDQLVLGRAQGLPVRYIMNWYTRYPVVIFAKEEQQLSQPAGLRGKKVGIPGPFGASYVALRGILE
ncbi:MAG: ABC transporter substrate-binding protein, partial [Caldilineaceae bacterium]|nr:ABC transporter substrate-binding protein [Caldilineaceae bacterium]